MQNCSMNWWILCCLRPVEFSCSETKLNAYISVKENLYIRYMIQNVLCTISSFLDVLLKVFGVSLTDAITKQELEHHKQSCVPFCLLVKVVRAREDVRPPDNQSMNERMRRKTSKMRMRQPASFPPWEPKMLYSCIYFALEYSWKQMSGDQGKFHFELRFFARITFSVQASSIL